MRKMIASACAAGLSAWMLTTGGGCAESAMLAAAGVTAGFGLAQGQAEAFIRGELHAAREVSMERAINAAVHAMRGLQLEIKTERRGKHDAYIMAKAAHGPEFKVGFEEKSPIVTKLEIRIGLMGDQAVSRLLLLRIDEQLGISHPLVPVEESPIVAPPPKTPPQTQPDELEPPRPEPEDPQRQDALVSPQDE